MSDAALPADPVAITRRWLERAVIGLNLCPFAKAVVVKDQVRFVVSAATTEEALLEDLAAELVHLRDTPAELTDTTLLIHPQVLGDFLDYNDFLGIAEGLVAELDLEGVLQVASFHPHYRFDGTADDDIANYTNRSPFPTLHLLREDSVSRAVDAYPDPDVIVERNVRTLDRLGHDGWRRLFADATSDAPLSTPLPHAGEGQG
ncbi:DUF1415 domain-containing protein [Luteimonas yindakuii]|uniref:DUF1415 domain-containing protein n=1 Tax=Luteimonas yindakuii TaxID=2565782 RepID=UPI0011076A3D|nr:DUF1415 domain-containing protein [Luteimonas yindakuii]QCU72738.1 DUF1415 domain-containing protein [Luteimonas yindakuii]